MTDAAARAQVVEILAALLLDGLDREDRRTERDGDKTERFAMSAAEARPA